MAKQMTAFISGFSCVVFLLGTHSFRYDPCQSSPCGLCPCTFLKNHYRCEPCSSISTSTTMKTVFTDFTTPHRNETRNLACLNLSNNDPLFQNCGHQGLNPQDNSNTICTRLAKLSQLCEKENGILTLQNIGNSSLITENLTSGLTTGEKAKLVTFYMQFVEATVLKAASEDVKGGNQSVTGPFMAFETLRLAKDFICKPENEPFTLKAEKQTMEIHCTTIQDSLGDVVAFISYADIGRILNKDFVSEEHLKAEEQLDTFFLNSKVVSGVLQSTKNGLLANPVNFTFQHEQVKKDNEKPLCVYWQGSSWSNEGCQVIASDENQTVCSCTHLSSFAILMASTTLKDDPVLTLITYVGLSLSLLCLLLAILTFLRCRPIQNTSTSLHLQLSLCLFLAYLLFLTGINRTKPKVLCSIIAGALHYLYLAAFTWMLLEGLQLFLTVRNLKVANYLSARNFKKKFVYPFGYGIPAVIVAVSAGIGPSNYGTHTHCWLNLRTGFIWTFTGPVSVIILINLSFYLTTLWILRDQLSSLNDEVSRIQNTRLLTFKAIAQLFILGCSWGLGFFLIETIQEPARSVIAYSFTIINVLQGFYIFLVHCLLNHKVREEYKLWFKKRKKSTKTESYDLSGSTTQTKTMEKTTDFSGKTSKISWEK